MVLVIDNYDSFTYNLVQYLGELGADVAVRRNDAGRRVDEIAALAPERDRHLAGPGPARGGRHLDRRDPRASGRRMPILGVCLGHQAIGLAFGGDGRARAARRCTARRRRSSTTARACSPACRAVSRPAAITRWSSPSDGCPPSSRSTARTQDDGTIMGLRHRDAARCTACSSIPSRS